MARRKPATARRTITRIEKAAERVAFRIAEEIVEEIRLSGPVSSEEKPEHLRDSYYVVRDRVTGDALIKSRSRYWIFVERGTRRTDPDYQDARPHVGPAIDIVRARHT